MGETTMQRYVSWLVDETERLASAAESADPATAVPTCPEWDLAELCRHVGTAQRWGAAHVERRSDTMVSPGDLDMGVPDDPAALPAWLRATGAHCGAIFAAAAPDEPVWTWTDDHRAGFWARRMAHETAVHRGDACLAVEAMPLYPPAVAADGVDEFLTVLPTMARFKGTDDKLCGAGEVVGLVAPDAGVAWRIELSADGLRWTRIRGSEAPADATAVASAPAGTVLLLAYRRLAPDADGVSVTGEAALLDRWLDATRF